MSFDGKAFGRDVVEAVKAYLGREIAALIQRIGALESREPAHGPKGEPGRDGVDGVDGKDGRDGVDGKDAPPVARDMVMDAIRNMPDIIADAVAAHLAQNLPSPGKDGRDGVDGKDADPAEIERQVNAAVAKAMGELPKPQDGKSVSVDDVRPLIEQQVTKAVEALPKAKDGVGLAGALIDQKGHLVVTLSDGSHRTLGLVVGRDGVDGQKGDPGKDGRDGFSLSDFDTELKDDGRTLLLKFGSGDVLETHELVFPVVIDRGVWKEQDYQQGDGVTWGGSFWIAQKDTATKPDTPDSDWRLAVKRGRDGRDGKPGEKGEPGNEGRPGRDLTQMGLDGKKW